MLLRIFLKLCEGNIRGVLTLKKESVNVACKRGRAISRKFDCSDQVSLQKEVCGIRGLTDFSPVPSTNLIPSDMCVGLILNHSFSRCPAARVIAVESKTAKVRS